MFNAITQKKYTICISSVLNISFDDDIAELFFELDGVADAFRLLTGNQCTARSAEGIEYDAVAKT